MTLKELQYIVTIAEEKSISRASARLYVSQPYLSQCLMRIERQHDMPLFRRTQHGLVLTFAGEQYVETARKIVKLYNDFETGLCEISNMRKGRLTIGTTIHLGSMVFSTILPIFRELYPNIELRLEEGPWPCGNRAGSERYTECWRQCNCWYCIWQDQSNDR